ncbi:hypothetical protein JKX24_09535 [Serratia proteamaculans]|uniref:Uncharacterized protein n=1 Tax=Serratia proteamaculans TaxID=28151 RepID=A0A7U0RQV4_SERPR|nr:hypothetical protein [Serratia proteamaculans]MBO1505171.1 hypothetical protein [Serratia proteamaculans]MDW5512893.1 hypothetical protein [Serratia proteamaculans]QQX56086.1 hypothetical protein JKX24_09535 [Serratia proteamaculans]
MKTIDCNLLDQIAGGRGNNGGDRTDNGGRNKQRGRGNGGGAPKTKVNDAAVIGLLGSGAVFVSRFGSYGLIAAGILTGVAGVIGYSSDSPYNDNGDRGRGAFGGDANPNSVNGQCHW